MAHDDSELIKPLLGNHKNVEYEGHFSYDKEQGKTLNATQQNDTSSNSQIHHVRKDVIVVQCTLDNTNMICGTVCGFASPGSQNADVEARTASSRKLMFAIGFCVLFMGVEVAGGIYANSLAILTDAAHLLSDVAGFAVSLFAIWASSWQATARQTYGFHRVEILGALVSIQIIWLVTGILVYEAIDRILHKEQPVVGSLMFWIATMGLLVNVVLILILGHGHGHDHGHGQGHDHEHDHGHNGHDHNHGENSLGYGHDKHDQDNHGVKKPMHLCAESNQQHDVVHSHDHGSHANESSLPDDIEHNKNTEAEVHDPQLGFKQPGNLEIHNEPKESVTNLSKNINIRGAYLHAFGDLIQSIGVMVAGAAIWYNPEWKILDLVCTLLFSLLVLGTTIKMLRDILEVLMESTPREIDKTLLETGLLELESVVAVHDLHVWAITLGKTILACHVRIAPNADSNEVLQSIVEYCKKEFNICHVTVQVERD